MSSLLWSRDQSVGIQLDLPNKMNFRCTCLLLLLGVPALLAQCPEPKCRWDCGLQLRADGCAHCDCRVAPNYPYCPNVCSQYCEGRRKDNGCLECRCPPTFPPPPSNETNILGGGDCTKYCPSYCGQPDILPNGCLRCNCNKWREGRDDSIVLGDCTKYCPSYCGTPTVLPNGCLRCNCGQWRNQRDSIILGGGGCTKYCPSYCGEPEVLPGGCLRCNCGRWRN